MPAMPGLRGSKAALLRPVSENGSGDAKPKAMSRQTNGITIFGTQSCQGSKLQSCIRGACSAAQMSQANAASDTME